MLLKKQTVWLLTMLSLVVVLSVYYITSPEAPQENMALVEEDQNKEKGAEGEKQPAERPTEQKEDVKGAEAKATEDESAQAEKDSAIISSVESDELFTALRLEIEDERNKLREGLQDIVASADVTAQEKSEAMDKMQELADVAAKEAVIETLIKSKGYEDALVRADGGEVRITIKSKEEHSRTQANEIIQLVRGELGSKYVAVEFEPAQ
ncbi:SpoIIIAH-like family protein [Priestia abyssalis]|uniref:SpoIIIAH-like family protein n=1 Tax=Priestia abyssalis TaxID=1221450 RepID=UPI000995199C|nr:SpoIIIAH-like family protein [Priestia abyssalis]